jgi:hypothetical protein
MSCAVLAFAKGIVDLLDHHEGTATWVGAGASFLAVLAALGIALFAAGHDARARAAEKADQRRAALASMGHAYMLLDMMWQHSEPDPAATVLRSAISATLATASSALNHALAQPVSDEAVLGDALNMQAAVAYVIHDIAVLPADMRRIRANELLRMMKPTHGDLEAARERWGWSRSTPPAVGPAAVSEAAAPEEQA